MRGDPDGNLPLWRVEVRARLDQPEGVLHGLGVRRTAGRLEEPPNEPAAEALAAHWPGFPVAIDRDVREARAVGRVEQVGRAGEAGEAP